MIVTRQAMINLVLCNLLAVSWLIVGAQAQAPQCTEILGSSFGRVSYVDAPITQVATDPDSSTIYVLTQLNTLYRSVDDGQHFSSIMSLLPDSDQIQPHYNQNGVQKIIQTATEDHIVFLGFGYQYWTSTAQGVNYYNFSEPWVSITPHPSLADVLLGIQWSGNCLESLQTGCYLIAKISKDLGATWKEITSPALKAQWGDANMVYVLTGAPQANDNQLTRYDTSGNQPKLDYAYDSGIIDFLFEDSFLYVVQRNTTSNNLMLSIGTQSEDDDDLVLASFYDVVNEWSQQLYSYQFLDNSEQVTFLHAVRSDPRYGSVYQAPTSAPSFWASTRNVRISSLNKRVDFQRYSGLEGIYFTNQYNVSVLLHEENIDQYLVSMISFNKGAVWNVLPAPADAQCSQPGCSLHLLGAVDGAQIWTSPDAVGLVVASGNVGTLRETRADRVNLYLSRDAGYSWSTILTGPQVFAWGNFGGLFVAAASDQSTNSLSWSWNQGIEWNTCNFSSSAVEAAKIYHLGSPYSTKFLLVGGQDSGGSVVGVLVALDFSTSLPNDCSQSFHNVGDAESDFEYWTTKWGDDCLLGKADKYTRRKQNSACVVGTSYEFIPDVSASSVCPCTRQDYTCEGGCWTARVDEFGNTTCVNICEGQENDPTGPPEQCYGSYKVSQGYTLVVGDSCSPAANEFGSVERTCDITYDKIFDTWFDWVLLLSFILLIFVLCLIIVLVRLYQTNDELNEKLSRFVPEWCTRLPEDEEIDYSTLNSDFDAALDD